MNTLFRIAAAWVLGASSLVAQDHSEEALALPNPGFEEDLEGWTTERANEENVQVTAEAAASGSKGLHLKDTDSSPAFRVTSSPVEVQPGMAYKVSFQGLSTGAAGGIGVEMVFRGYGGEPLQPVLIPRFWPAVPVRGSSSYSGYTAKAIAPEGANTLAIVITSFSSPGAEVMVDDFSITPVPAEAKLP